MHGYFSNLKQSLYKYIIYVYYFYNSYISDKLKEEKNPF